jgi:MFS family permease
MGGRIIDRLGPYNVWAGCSTLLIIGALLFPVIGDTVIGMLFIRLIHGFGAGPIMATAPLVAAQWFSLEERAVVIGFQGATVAVGAIISLNFVPFMFRATGSWQAAAGCARCSSRPRRWMTSSPRCAQPWAAT